jgi:hypothetical protein
MNEMRSERFCIALLGMLWGLASVIGCALAQTPDEPKLVFLATDPATSATLGKEEPFYIQFQVQSTQSVGVMPDAYYRGEPVMYGLGTGGITVLPAGGGTAVTKVFFWGDNHTPVDELRLYVGNPKNPLSGKMFSLPVKLIWSGQPATPRTLAAWAQASLPDKPVALTTTAASATAEKSYGTSILVIVALIALGLGLMLRELRARRQRPPGA